MQRWWLSPALLLVFVLPCGVGAGADDSVSSLTKAETLWLQKIEKLIPTPKGEAARFGRATDAERARDKNAIEVLFDAKSQEEDRKIAILRLVDDHASSELVAAMVRYSESVEIGTDPRRAFKLRQLRFLLGETVYRSKPPALLKELAPALVRLHLANYIGEQSLLPIPPALLRAAFDRAAVPKDEKGKELYATLQKSLSVAPEEEKARYYFANNFPSSHSSFRDLRNLAQYSRDVPEKIQDAVALDRAIEEHKKLLGAVDAQVNENRILEFPSSFSLHRSAFFGFAKSKTENFLFFHWKDGASELEQALERGEYETLGLIAELHFYSVPGNRAVLLSAVRDIQQRHWLLAAPKLRFLVENLAELESRYVGELAGDPRKQLENLRVLSTFLAAWVSQRVGDERALNDYAKQLAKFPDAIAARALFDWDRSDVLAEIRNVPSTPASQLLDGYVSHAQSETGVANLLFALRCDRKFLTSYLDSQFYSLTGKLAGKLKEGWFDVPAQGDANTLLNQEFRSESTAETWPIQYVFGSLPSMRVCDLVPVSAGLATLRANLRKFPRSLLENAGKDPLHFEALFDDALPIVSNGPWEEVLLNRWGAMGTSTIAASPAVRAKVEAALASPKVETRRAAVFFLAYGGGTETLGVDKVTPLLTDSDENVRLWAARSFYFRRQVMKNDSLVTQMTERIAAEKSDKARWELFRVLHAWGLRSDKAVETAQALLAENDLATKKSVVAVLRNDTVYEPTTFASVVTPILKDKDAALRAASLLFLAQRRLWNAESLRIFAETYASLPETEPLLQDLRQHLTTFDRNHSQSLLAEFRAICAGKKDPSEKVAALGAIAYLPLETLVAEEKFFFDQLHSREKGVAAAATAILARLGTKATSLMKVVRAKEVSKEWDETYLAVLEQMSDLEMLPVFHDLLAKATPERKAVLLKTVARFSVRQPYAITMVYDALPDPKLRNLTLKLIADTQVSLRVLPFDEQAAMIRKLQDLAQEGGETGTLAKRAAEVAIAAQNPPSGGTIRRRRGRR